MIGKFEILSPEDWKKVNEGLHKEIFDWKRDEDADRADYVVVFKDDKEDILGYISCREYCKRTVYWHFGGVKKELRGTKFASTSMDKVIKLCKERYDTIIMHTENVNLPMLKLALNKGFIITGMRTILTKLYLELTLDF